MSVYISGMEMPNNCMDCPFKGFDRTGGRGNICIINDSITFHAVLDGDYVKLFRMGDCPLIPVPPHGRCVDADLLCKVLQKNSEDEWNNKTAPFSWAYAYDCVKDTVENMPTIIPAETSKEAT